MDAPIKLTYTSFKDKYILGNEKSLVYQHLETSTGSTTYYHIFAKDASIMYECFINSSDHVSDVSDYETNYKASANQRLFGNESVKWYQNYRSFINEAKNRNKLSYLSVETLDGGTSNARYIISFIDGNRTFSYVLSHSNTNEKTDFEINYLQKANRTLDDTKIICDVKHFNITSNTTDLWKPEQGFILRLDSIYFYGYCDASSNKKFIFEIEAQTVDGWVVLGGISVYNSIESFRETLKFNYPLDIKKGAESSIRLRAKVSGDVLSTNYVLKLSVYGFEIK